MSKDLVSEKEDIKCKSIINGKKQQLTLIILQKKTYIGEKFLNTKNTI